MHIAIDISPLESGHSGRGVGVYTKRLIESIQTYEKSHSVSLITHSHDIPESCNIVHYPYFDPFFLTLPFFRSYPSVVTIHDVIPLLFPEKFPPGIKGSIRYQIQKLSLSGIRRIITDSNTSKQDIQKIIGRNPSTIDVVYLAPSVSVGTKSIRSTREEGPYILYVGDVNWNKNIHGLISALAHVLKKIPNLKLILVGKSFCDDSIKEVQAIKSHIQSLGVGSQIRMPGYVEASSLHDLYTHAICLVQPSFYEGFGFPVVDALSLGCPVVSSSVSSLSEISGPSFQADPKNPEQIAERIIQMAQLSELKRKKLVSNGYEWVEQFTWKRVAKETIESYKKALS